jgi:hypothetical protein
MGHLKWSLTIILATISLQEWCLLGCYAVWNLALTRATRRNIPEDTILHSHRCENLKSWAGVEPGPLLLWPFIGLLLQSWMIDHECGAISGTSDWQGKPTYSAKNGPTATLSATDPTWLNLGSNPGHCGGKLAINQLSYNMAIILTKLHSLIMLGLK